MRMNRSRRKINNFLFILKFWNFNTTKPFWHCKGIGSKHLFFRDRRKYIIMLFSVAAISVHPKPMVEGGGGGFGEDGWKSALLQMTSPIIGHNGKKDASVLALSGAISIMLLLRYG